MDNYIMTLSMMMAWFKDHDKDLPKYYEYTMRELVTIYTYDQIINCEVLQQSIENNIIRLIEDNKIFIKEHLEKKGIIKSRFEIICDYL